MVFFFTTRYITVKVAFDRIRTFWKSNHFIDNRYIYRVENDFNVNSWETVNIFFFFLLAQLLASIDSYRTDCWLPSVFTTRLNISKLTHVFHVSRFARKKRVE